MAHKQRTVSESKPKDSKSVTKVPRIETEVYVEVRVSSYGYASDRKWKDGVVKGLFTNGDLLVEYNTDDRERCSIKDVAFKDEKQVIDLVKNSPEGASDVQ